MSVTAGGSAPGEGGGMGRGIRGKRKEEIDGDEGDEERERWRLSERE